MIKYKINPFELIVDVCNKLYPSLVADIYFVPTDVMYEILKDNDSHEQEAFGIALQSKDGDRHVIYVNSDIPTHCCIEVVGHEVAHLIAGYERDHDDTWNSEYEKIHDAYEERYDTIITHLEQELVSPNYR